MGTNSEAGSLLRRRAKSKYRATDSIPLFREQPPVWNELETELRMAGFYLVPEQYDAVKLQCWHLEESESYVYVDWETHHAFMAERGRVITSEPGKIIDYLQDPERQKRNPRPLSTLLTLV